jgi:hypothetical protein
MHAMLNGRFAQAIAYNPLAVVAAPFLLYAFCRSTWYWLLDRRPQRYIARPRLTRAIAVAVILFWVLRNIPVYPLTLLAPHDLT